MQVRLEMVKLKASQTSSSLLTKCNTVQQVGLAYGPIRACSYSYTAQAAGPQRSPRKASLTPGSADAMREKSMFAAYIAASVGHS